MPTSSSRQGIPMEFLQSGQSEMARRIRAFDWPQTPLGAIATWPGELRGLVELMLASPFASSLVCGPSRILLYNDALARHFDGRHPAALGRPLAEALPDDPAVAGALYDRVFAGESVHVPAQSIDLAGDGRPAGMFDAYLTPVRDAGGDVAFAHMTGFEITARLQNEHERDRQANVLRESEERQTFLLRLSDALQPLTDPVAVQETAMKLLAEQHGVMRAMYLDLAADENTMFPAARFERDAPPNPESLRLSDYGPDIAAAFRAGKTLFVRDAQAEAASDEQKAAYRAIGVRAWIVAPLVRGGRLHAVVAVQSGVARNWTEIEVQLVKDLAERTWDAVERARAEAALQRSETRFRALVTTGSSILYRMSPDWRLMHELDGRHVLADTVEPAVDWVEKYLLPEDRADIAAVIQAAIASRSMFELEHRVRAADGGIGWVLSRAIPILDANGVITEWFGAATDITARHQAEAALSASEEKYRTLFEAMAEGFYVAEAIFDDQNRCIDILYRDENPAAVRMTGQSFKGKLLSELGVYEQHWLDIFGDTAKSGKTQRLERYAEPDGIFYDFSVFKPPHSGKNELAVTFRDVTARRMAEDALRRSEERQTFLLALADALRPLNDVETIQATAMRILGRHLDADRAFYYFAERDPAGWVHVVTTDYHSRPDMVSLVGRYPEATLGPTFFAKLARGETLILPDIAHTPDLTDEEIAGYRSIQVGSHVAVPLLKDGAYVAGVCVSDADARSWTKEEIELVVSVAERTWSAVERGRAETGLRISEDKYRTLFETMSQGYCQGEIIRDASGRAVDYRVLNANPAFGRLIGTDTAQAVGRAASDVIPGLEGWWTDTFERVVTTGEQQHVEHEVAALGRWYECRAYRESGDRFVTLFDEITGRKQAEFALRESEERQAFLLKLSDAVRSLAEPADITGTVTRLVGERLDASRAYLAEWPPGADYGEVARDYAAAGLASLAGRYPIDAFRSAYDRVSKGDTWIVEDNATAPGIGEAERKYHQEAGVIAWVDVPLTRHGRPIAVLCVVQDKLRRWTEAEIKLCEEAAERCWAAVERARAEAAMRDSEDRFRSFAENSTDVLWIVNADTRRLEYLSPSFTSIWGESRESVMADLGRWAALVHPDDRARAASALPRALEGETVMLSYRVIRPSDGAERWIQDTGFPIRDEHGRITRVGGISQDLTERTRTELEIRAKRRELRTLVENIPQLVWRAGSAGNWTWASPQWTEYTGQPEVESRGWGWLETLHPADRKIARDAWKAAERLGLFSADYRLKRRDGTYHWFQTRATPLQEDAGGPIEWFGTSTDIDDIRRLQQHERVLLLELQHRVRNTLAVVRSIVRRTAGEESSLADYMMHVEGRIDAFARVQASVTRDPNGGVDLAYLVAEELRAVGAREGDSATIRGPKVSLSPKAAEMLGLAIHELATNAIKYGALTDPRGEIAVRWNKAGVDGGSTLEFSWTEHGMRLAVPPVRKGFGTMILTRTLGYELHAHAELAFPPSGLTYKVTIPLEHAQASAMQDAAA